jgi:hypothetical protein
VSIWSRIHIQVIYMYVYLYIYVYIYVYIHIYTYIYTYKYTYIYTGSFEVVDWSTLRAYQLTYSMAYMPGLFSSTQLVTIMPRYMLVNCLEEIVMVVQKGAGEEGYLSVGSFKAESWHKSRHILGTNVQIRSASSV